MTTASHFVRWDMPFAEERDPSVSVITEQGGNVATLVVAPSGIDKYPKYLVLFEKVIVLLYYEEAFSFERGYRALSGIDSNLCAYLWIDSPWLESYRKGAEVFEWKDMQHYLVIGGDSIVELIAAGQPKVQRSEKRAVVETHHEV